MFFPYGEINYDNVSRVLRTSGDRYHMNSDGVVEVSKDNGLKYFLYDDHKDPVIRHIEGFVSTRLTVREIAKNLAIEFNLMFNQVLPVVETIGTFNDKASRTSSGSTQSCYISTGYDVYKVDYKKLTDALKLLK